MGSKQSLSMALGLLIKETNMSSIVKTTLVITVFSLLILITNTAQAVTIGTFWWHDCTTEECYDDISGEQYFYPFFSVSNDSYGGYEGTFSNVEVSLVRRDIINGDSIIQSLLLGDIDSSGSSKSFEDLTETHFDYAMLDIGFSLQDGVLTLPTLTGSGLDVIDYTPSSAVPEAATLFLVGSGFAGLFARRLRNRLKI